MENIIGDYRIVKLTDTLKNEMASLIVQKFGDCYKLAEEWDKTAKSIKVSGEFDLANMKRARDMRLEIRKKRIDIENTRKSMKEDSIKEGRAIDAVAAQLKELIEPTENYLLEQENFADNLKEKRKQELVSVRNAAWYSISTTPVTVDFSTLTEDQFSALLETEKKAQELKRANEELEKLRIAKEKEELENLRKENERIRREQEIAEQQRRELEKQNQSLQEQTKKIETAIEEVKKKELSAYDQGWNDALKTVYENRKCSTEIKEVIRGLKKV